MGIGRDDPDLESGRATGLRYIPQKYEKIKNELPLSYIKAVIMSHGDDPDFESGRPSRSGSGRATGLRYIPQK